MLNIGDQREELKTLFKLSGADNNLPYKINWIDFSDGPTLNAAYASNRIDIGGEGDIAAAQVLQQGVQLKVIASDLATAATDFLVAAPNSGINTLADLKGKTLVYDTGGGQEAFALRGLSEAGLTEKDIHQVNDNNGYAVIEGGHADAAVLFHVEQEQAYVKEHPGTKVLGTNLTLKPPFYDYEVATATALANPGKQAAIQDFLTRYKQAEDWEASHESAYANAYYVGVEHETQAEADSAAAQSAVHLLPITSAEQTALQSVVNLEASSGAIKKAFSVAPLYDNTASATWNKIVDGS